MKTTLIATLIFLGLSACSRKTSDEAQEQNPMLATTDEPVISDHVARFRGVAEVNQILRSRLVSNADFNIMSSLIRTSDSFIATVVSGASTKDDVAALMGANKGLGLRVASDSMRSSTVHTLLWGLTFHAFSEDIGALCSPSPTELQLNVNAHEIAQRICKSDELQDQDIKELWDLLLRKDATPEEFQLWNQLEKPEFLAKKGSERLSAIVYAMLFGPEFMLGR